MASTTTPSPEPPALASSDGPEDPPRDDAAPSDLEEVLVVQLRDVGYAVPAALVREVAPAAPVTPLPGTAPWVLGLAAVRGALLPVGDLSRRGTDGADDAADVHVPSRDGWMVVLDDGRRSAAFVGLRVRGVALARAVDDAPHVDGARLVDVADGCASARGLPVQGAVRLVEDGRRSAGAGPVRLARRGRARGAARAPVPTGAVTIHELARLDVAALLDDLLDQGG